LQHREETTVHLIERGLEGLAVRPSCAPERFPREPVDARRLPGALEGLGIGSGEEPLECAGKSVEASRRFHPHQTTPDWPAGNPGLSTSVWKTKWKSCWWGGECCAYPWVSLTLPRIVLTEDLCENHSSSPPLSRWRPAPAQQGRSPSASRAPSPNHAERRCSGPPSWRSTRSMPNREFGVGSSSYESSMIRATRTPRCGWRSSCMRTRRS